MYTFESIGREFGKNTIKMYLKRKNEKKEEFINTFKSLSKEEQIKMLEKMKEITNEA